MNDYSVLDDEVEKLLRQELRDYLTELLKLNPDLYTTVAELMIKYAPRQLPNILQGVTALGIAITIEASPMLRFEILSKLCNSVPSGQITKRSNQAYRRIQQLRAKGAKNGTT